MKHFSIFLFAFVAALGFLRADEKYPLETCVVSGEKLGAMGEPYVLNYEGTEVHFCCEHCKPRFEKQPAKYLEKLKAARKSE